MFQPDAGTKISIGGTAYRFTEHPALPGSGIPFGQDGRAGVVFRLQDDAGNFRALKVFKPAFRQPALVGLTRKLEAYAGLPGLTVCRRVVLTPQAHADLLRQYPDLLYAALMPWIAGHTWQEITQPRTALDPRQSLALAHAFAVILAHMEQEGVAHGDLSASNLLIEGLDAGAPRVELVDVEQLYAPGLLRPGILPGGSPGYAHKSAGGLWEAEADRFAGAVLLAEMLGWCDERVRDATAGETYFAEGELQAGSGRYRRLYTTLAERWGNPVAALFEQAWHSETVQDCPPFGSWLIALPEDLPPDPAQNLAGWLATAQAAADSGDRPAAIAAYRNALRLAEPGSSLAQELPLIIAGLEEKVSPGSTQSQMILSSGNRAESHPRRASQWLWLIVLLLLAAGLTYVIIRSSDGGGMAEITSSPAADQDSAPTQVPPTHVAQVAVVPGRMTGDTLSRAGPGSIYSIVDPLSAGDPVTIVAKDRVGAWLIVLVPGKYVWVPSSLVSTPGRETTSVEVAATIPAPPLPLAVVEIAANQGWQSTGIHVDAGTQLYLEVIAGKWTHERGSIAPNPGIGVNYICALALSMSECAEPLPSAAKGTLVGRVGDGLFNVGHHALITVVQSGELRLRMNDEDEALSDNSGSITVQVTQVSE